MAVSPDQLVPQLSPRSKPTTNLVAGKTLAHAAPRFEAKQIKVWPPNGGEPEVHDSFNARDLIRLHGWTDIDPNAAKAAAEAPSETDEGEEVYDESAENAELLEAAAKKLQAHRDVLNRMGVKYNKNWGLRRLKEEIEAAGGIVPTE